MITREQKEELEAHLKDLFAIHNIDPKEGWAEVRAIAYKNWEMLTIEGHVYVAPNPVEELEDRCASVSPEGHECTLLKGHNGRHYRNPKIMWEGY